MDDIEAGSTVYFLGHCLDNGIIYKTTVTEVLARDDWGRQRFKLKGYDGIAVAPEVALTETEALQEAAVLKAQKIENLEMELKLLRKRVFVVNE